MKVTKFDEFISIFDLTCVNDIAVDHIDYYPITIRNLKDLKLISVQVKLSEELYEMYREKLAEQLKKMGIKKITYQKGVLTIPITYKMDVNEVYSKVKQLLTPILQGKVHTLTCAFCNTAGSDLLAIKDNAYATVHKQCYDTNRATTESIAKQSSVVGLMKGAIGAFVGALLPMAVAFFLIATLEISVGWLYVFSPFAAVVGYELMKAPYGKKAMLITTIASIVAFLIFVFANCFYAVQYLGLSNEISFIDTFEIVGNLLVSEVFVEAFAFETIFFVIGLGIVLFAHPLSIKKLEKDFEAKERATLPMGSNI